MATRSDSSTPSIPDETTVAATNARPTSDSGRREPTREGETVREYRGTGIIWSAVGLLLAITALVVVIIQNTHDVAFEFLWFDVETPLSLVLAITFGVALVMGEVIGFVWRRRRRTRLREREELRRLRERAG